MAKRKQTEYYVNNKEFLAAITEYRDKVIRAKEEEKPRPRVTNYIGECFLKIATHLSYKPNFVNYMFREDMICDGIENCVQYIHNFNPEKSTNPFAYFTQIIQNTQLVPNAQPFSVLPGTTNRPGVRQPRRIFWGTGEQLPAFADAPQMLVGAQKQLAVGGGEGAVGEDAV